MSMTAASQRLIAGLAPLALAAGLKLESTAEIKRFAPENGIAG